MNKEKQKKECKFQYKGNLCRFEEYCKQREPFDRKVQLNQETVYGVCRVAPVF